VKTVIIIYLLVFFAAIASAEVYTWEDAEAIHFTDDPSSVPEVYRDKAINTTTNRIGNTVPQVRVAMTQQNRPAITRQNQTAVQQVNPELQRQAAVAVSLRETSASGASAKIVKETFPSLATLIVVWTLLALFLAITWGFTIADIVKSSFITPAIKTAWMLLVVFLPLVGMEFYFILGVSQKSISTSYSKKQQYETHARLT
jgi:hypothetical protein